MSTQPISVRAGRPDDAGYVVRAHQEPHALGHVHGPTAERFREALADQDRFVAIVESGGRPVGTFMLAFSEPPWLVELAVLVVSEPRRGYGRFALNWILNRAFRELGAHRVSLEVAARNAPARRLYEALGFVYEGTWRDGYREDDGTFHDLCAYGILEAEFSSPERHATSPR